MARGALWLALASVFFTLEASAAPLPPPLTVYANQQLDAYEVENRLGVQILDAPVAGKQPVNWYGRSAELAVSSGALRLLSVQSIRDLVGGTVQQNSNRALFSLGEAQLLSVQRLPSATGEQIVLNLDKPAAYQTLTLGSNFQITVQAKSAVLASSLPFGLVSENSPVGIRLEIGASSPGFYTVSTLGSPPRIVIDRWTTGRSDYLQAWTPDLVYHESQRFWEEKPRRITWVTFLPKNNRLGLLVNDPLRSLQPISAMASLQNALVAVNGGFFNRNTAESLGALRRNGQWLSSPVPGLKPRGVLAWSDKGNWTFERLTWQGSLQFGEQSFPLVALNDSAFGNGFGLFTSKTYTPVGGELVGTVRKGQLASISEGSVGLGILIPEDGYLLVAKQSAIAKLKSIAIDTPVDFKVTVLPEKIANFPNLIGAGPLLLQEGKLALDPNLEQFRSDVRADGVARTAIARRGDQGFLVVVSTEGNASGMSLEAFSRFLQTEFQVTDALNLDGGGSSAFYLGGHLRDRNSGRFERPIANGLGLWPIPEGDAK
jgi:exopolysaccharide biosynthesis protein